MQATRTKTFAAIFIVAILGGVFVYRKESATIAPVASQQTTTQSSDNHVKGSEISAQPLAQISDSDSDYSAANLALHMTLSAENIIWFTNYERVQNNLAPLVENSALDESALLKDQDMFTYQYFDHTRPGTTIAFNHFFDEAHYAFIKAGENLAQGTFSSTQELMNDWMNSPDHRENILDPAYTQIGAYVQNGLFNGFETTLAVQHFGEPSTQCPAVDESADITMQQLQTQVAQLGRTMTTIKSSLQKTDQSASAYSGLITDYNNLATNYNQLIAEIQTIGVRYNGQVAAFDACVGK